MPPDIAERLAKIETILSVGLEAIDKRFESVELAMDKRFGSLEHRLFGNGQPGEVTRIWSEITELQAYRNARASESAFSWKLAGVILTGLGGIIAALELMFHSKKG